MDAIAKQESPVFGFLYALLRGTALSLLFYLPFYLLHFTPITPSYLKILDSPYYFLYAAIFWPLFGLLSCIYLCGVTYMLFRLCGYKAGFDKIFNLGGLLVLTIGVVLILFDWLMVAINCHTNAVFMGIAHITIADPWSITLSAIFYKKYFSVPIWLAVIAGILVRLLYIPIAMVFIRT